MNDEQTENQTERQLDLFERRDLSVFNAKVQKVANLITISRDYKIIGTAGLKYLKYYNDIDINEIYEKKTDAPLTALARRFQQIFKEVANTPDLYITDFKAGMDSDGDPLRWDKNDIKRNKKTLKDGRIVSLEDVLLQKATLKIDIVARVDGSYLEISDNYFIKFGEYANYFPFDFNKEKILNSIEHSYDEYFYASGNIFKGLKRAFAYFKMKDPDRYKLEITSLAKFFNGSVGFLYKCYSEVSTIIELLEQTFKKPSLKDIKFAINQIYSAVPEGGWKDTAKKLLLKAEKAKSKAKMIEALEDAKTSLFWECQKLTADFVLKDKSVALY
jgi:hypothetical protein